MEGYFATVGKGKKGFSLSGSDGNGDPLYAGGVRGAIERNALRYYFAIQSYMDTLHFPLEMRFESQITRWYNLTDMFKDQLFEISREDYLEAKRREHQNQIRLQAEKDSPKSVKKVSTTHPLF